MNLESPPYFSGRCVTGDIVSGIRNDVQRFLAEEEQKHLIARDALRACSHFLIQSNRMYC